MHLAQKGDGRKNFPFARMSIAPKGKHFAFLPAFFLYEGEESPNLSVQTALNACTADSRLVA